MQYLLNWGTRIYVYIPELLLNPPKYSEVINCWLSAVLPYPGAPTTTTRCTYATGLILGISRDKELGVQDMGETGPMSPSEEHMLLMLRERKDSLLYIPVEFIPPQY
ncbi:hypothetical protein DPMN_171305 [Dreissena polymorpha]|uniref:Uncharacterized protein n=1 Tax=Dreissena polymorpha TaxID=45954 RepID=A0A9D4DYP3_DREPO|nr:hypothetical protein DPMN_171305 [Dreissena polymorpha]